MRSIYKYELEPRDVQIINIPGAVPLSVGCQGGRHNEKLVMWSVMDDMLPNRRVRVVIRGTGHDAHPHDGKFLGTAQMISGLVWHVFVENT